MKSTLPCFYVNSWTGSDGALLRYTRGANGLVPTEQVEVNRTDGAPPPGLVKASGSLQAGAILLDLRRSDIGVLEREFLPRTSACILAAAISMSW